jgi:hypothetical protein
VRTPLTGLAMKHAAKLPSRAGASSGISAHRLSHGIAKQAPPRKIRIVHVLAPEIIKTEARHFREVVQRLTGKPAAAAASPEYASSYSPPGSCDTASEEEGPGAGSSVAAIKAEVKEEAETSSSGGGYLRALGAEDGSNESFFQGLEDFLFSSSCNSMDGFSF